ncbi:CheR family methyltransferase [Geoalkalibacter subterraneus]|uniref:CheR family methyltransferase n=1 Tax=Geoalkalibacter subterraneus TaxID=483547 RepID=UPI00069422A8|nr:CheR family methyltransferase [Geoalkalibacter subterraneus]
MPRTQLHNPAPRVCIADTEGGLCAGLADVVTEAGASAEPVTLDQDLERILSEEHWDVVILGLELSGRSGLERLRLLETRHVYRRLPVVVVADFPELEFELPDVFDFLPAPVDSERFLVSLQQALQLQTPLHNTRQYAPLTRDDLFAFQAFLIQHSGLRFDLRNKNMLERGLQRRMRVLGIDCYRAYLDYLTTSPYGHDELNRLLRLLTVGETCFFRDLNQFEALRRQVLPELLAHRRGDRTLRIWSAGCSTGEEPYSLAIVLREFFPETRDWDVRILAGDLNPQALHKARSGVYGARALRMADPAIVDKYFHLRDKRYILDESIRRMVEYSSLNLQRHNYPDEALGLAEIDLLMCRNVLIYFNRDTCRSVLEGFYRTLRPGGYLFLGHAESLTSLSPRFERVSGEGGFYYRRPLHEEPPPAEESGHTAPATSAILHDASPKPSAASFTPPTAGLSRDAPLAKSNADLPSPKREEIPSTVSLAIRCREAAQAVAREDYGEAHRLYEDILKQDPQHCDALTGMGFLCANQGDYPQALEWGARALAVDDLHADAYFLCGLAFELDEQWEQAREEYRKALLIDLDFVMPYFQLSRIYQRQGRKEDARRELSNTLRRLDPLPPGTLVTHSGGFSREELMEICRSLLERIDAR